MVGQQSYNILRVHTDNGVVRYKYPQATTTQALYFDIPTAFDYDYKNPL
ncbi:MAG: hypothetical protein FWE13_05270 [Firmicutes bacterium]|nr:hypothetical protein [Bacillota bacterium]